MVAILSRREGIVALKKDIKEKRVINISSRHILSEVEAVLVERMKLTKQKAKAVSRLLERQSMIVTPKVIEKFVATRSTTIYWRPQQWARPNIS